MGVYNLLKVNQPVEIGQPESKFSYRSRVEVIYSKQITLAAPLMRGQLILLNPGTEVRVSYTDEMAVYSFDAQVISQSSSTPPTITLGEPYNFLRTQRRNFVRLETNLNIVFDQVDKDLKPVGEVHAGTAIDLSGGGIMFVCNTKLELGDILDTTIHISQKDLIKALGRVVRFVENLPSAKQKYSVGLEFTVIEESERDKIIKYIFNKQRELRKKGLL